jgi:hypothetical protein
LNELKKDTPLDLSVQKTTDDEEEPKDAREELDDEQCVDDEEEEIIRNERRNDEKKEAREISPQRKTPRSPTPIRSYTPTNNNNSIKRDFIQDSFMKMESRERARKPSCGESPSAEQHHRRNGSGDGNDDRMKTGGGRSSLPSPQQQQQQHQQNMLGSLPHQLRNNSNNNNNNSGNNNTNGGGGMSLDLNEKKVSAFSQIIAPRPMHPFPFPRPPTHFPGLPHGFSPNPFNPFFHNAPPLRNDVSNNIGAPSPLWQGKVGNRLDNKAIQSISLYMYIQYTGFRPYIA